MVGDKIYNNKWHAMLDYAAQPNSFKFYYYDHVWDQVNWQQEPEQDLKILEIEHCKFLRNKYNLIALAYSGGLDSHTVLQRFIDAKVHIDYIFCLSPSNSRSDPGNIEPFTAFDYLQANQHLFPNTKLIFANEDVSILQRVSGSNAIFGFDNDISTVNINLRFHPEGWGSRLKKEYPEIYKKLEDNNGCIVLGSNKPMVYKNNQGFWYTPNDHQDENMQSTELTEFFWTGSNPLLQIKQCHLVKTWMKNHNVNNSDLIFRSSDPTSFLKINRAFGREHPISPIFSIKNCRGMLTNGSYFNQEYGKISQNHLYAKLLESKIHDAKLKKLHDILTDYSKNINFQHFIKIDNNQFDIPGWLGTPRFLGT